MTFWDTLNEFSRFVNFEREARYDFRGNELKVLMWRANKDTKPNPVDLFNKLFCGC